MLSLMSQSPWKVSWVRSLLIFGSMFFSFISGSTYANQCDMLTMGGGAARAQEKPDSPRGTALSPRVLYAAAVWGTRIHSNPAVEGKPALMDGTGSTADV